MPQTVDIKLQTPRVYLLGDLHVDAAEFERQKFQRALDIIGEDAAILLGDVLDLGFFDDLGTQMERARALLKLQEDFDSKRQALTFSTFVQADEIMSRFKNLAAICQGNHDRRVSKRIGDDFLAYFAYKRNVPYIRGQALLRLHYGDRLYTIVVSHGSRGGRKASAPLNELEDILQSWAGVDAIVIGHHHKPVMANKSYFVVNGGEVVQVTTHLISVPSFLGWAHYAQVKGYSPPVNGMVRIDLEPFAPSMIYL